MINFSNHIIMAFTQLILDNHDLEICRQLVSARVTTGSIFPLSYSHKPLQLLILPRLLLHQTKGYTHITHLHDLYLTDFFFFSSSTPACLVDLKMPTSSKFDLFDKVDLTFNYVNDHPLEATILIPQILQSKPQADYPVLVNWHGGGFVVGHRMYEGWFPP